MGKVFLTDGQNRKTLAAVRSLAKKGISVTVGEETGINISRFSKYCAQSIVYPSPRKYHEDFYQFLINHLKNEDYDVFFPMDNETMLIATKSKKVISQYTRVPVPDLQTFMKAWNKAQTIKFALEHNIPCPKTFFIDDLEQITALKNQIEYPMVIKPQESYGSRGLVVVNSPEELLSNYSRVHQYYPYPMIQDFIPSGGCKYQVSVLFGENCSLKAVFVQNILRQYPVERGADTFSESFLNTEVEELGIRLLRGLNWYGIAGVEFVVDPRDGIPKLMEINPRFWASLQLAIYSGVDFPYLLYKMAVDGDVEPLVNYSLGRRYRWLLPGDILAFISDKNRLKRKPSYFSFDNHTSYAILSVNDPGPTFGLVLSFIRYSFSKEMWRRFTVRL